MGFQHFNWDFFKNLHLIFKPKLFIPTSEVDSLNQIPTLLKSLNAHAVIFDLDQTIVPFNDSSVDPSVANILNIIKANYNCCFLSNFPKTEEAHRRVQEIEKMTTVTVVLSKKKKPDPVPFMDALRYLNTKPQETIMIGDRILTDIIGANNVGIKTLLVKPIDWRRDPFIMVTIPRIIEYSLLKLIKIVT